MVLKKDRVMDKCQFSVIDTPILTIMDVPVKSSGKLFDTSLRTNVLIQNTCEELESWLKEVDETGLPGKFKAYMYQHRILDTVATATPIPYLHNHN